MDKTDFKAHATISTSTLQNFIASGAMNGMITDKQLAKIDGLLNQIKVIINQ